VSIRFIRTFLQLTAMLLIVAALSSCKNASVYGSVGVGVGYGSSGFNDHRGGSRMRGSISIGGRIR
jgi:predicted porin